jgi:hypothetical protein
MISEIHCARTLSCSNLGVNIWSIVRLAFPASQLSSPSFSTTFWMWLGLPHLSITSNPQCVCPHPINVTNVHLFMLHPWQWAHGHPWCNSRHFYSHYMKCRLPCGTRTITHVSFNHIPFFSSMSWYLNWCCHHWSKMSGFTLSIMRNSKICYFQSNSNKKKELLKLTPQ